jgi:hypothetical protein
VRREVGKRERENEKEKRGTIRKREGEEKEDVPSAHMGFRSVGGFL